MVDSPPKSSVSLDFLTIQSVDCGPLTVDFYLLTKMLVNVKTTSYASKQLCSDPLSDHQLVFYQSHKKVLDNGRSSRETSGERYQYHEAHA
jgi:hypothetical protein